MNSKWKQRFFRLLILSLAIASTYGLGRVYYRLTDGFLESNITYELPFDPRWTTSPLTQDHKAEIDGILDQEFFYLGKGCQSYVFVSQDGQYVVKFFKYQRFKPRTWFNFFTFIPAVDSYRLDKIEQKKRKLEYLFTSWKLAYEELQTETGIIYVHLNKGNEWNKSLAAYDKLGLKHTLQLDNIEFMIQKKATMLCPEILKYKSENNLSDGKTLINRLIVLLLGEYHRGYADNDHALMQNTGVFDGKPIHIDVGQFVKNPIAKDPQIYYQELFNKMWKFRLWLKENYPELASYTDEQLQSAIGPAFLNLTPQLNKASMGRIPAIIPQ